MSDTGPLASVVVSEDALRNLCFSHPFFRERYEGWDEVGRGAYATVVKTHCVDRGETVALKIFRFAGDEEDRRRFRREVQNAQRIVSPLLVRTYSPFDQGGLRWIEMEYVEGTTLDDELRRREAANEPLPFAEALEIAVCVTTALALAHREKVIHRDLKPANILLPRSQQPVAKLADFGISRFTGAEKLTSTGVFAGTPKFGSPEAFLGEPLGPPHDVYSLGLSLYLLFTNNRFPFQLPEDYSLQSLVAVHTRRTPFPARMFVPTMDTRLEALLARCLEKKPRRRPTADDVLRELEAVRAAVGCLPPQRRGPRRWLLVAAGLGAVAVTTLGLSVAGRGTPPVPAPAAAMGSRAEPPASPPTEARPAPAASLVARVSGSFLELRNLGTAMRRADVVLVAADGRSHRSTLTEGLGPGEVAFLPLDEFRPAAESGAGFSAVRVKGQGTEGTRDVTLRLR